MAAFHRPSALLPFALAACAAMSHAVAGGFQSADDIRAAAVAAVGAPAGTEATLDSALRLAHCTQPLQAVASAPRTALVRCPDAPGWRLYVPVQAQRETDVVVLAVPASPGMPIAASQLVVQRREVASLAGTPFSDPSAVVGRIPGRRLPAGSIPTGADFSAAASLRRGDPVTLVARSGGVEVRMQGRALGPAQAGGQIAVENTSSRRILRGRVAGDGLVEILP